MTSKISEINLPHIWDNHKNYYEQQQETHLKFYKTVAVPTLTYGSEVWTTTKKEWQLEIGSKRSVF